LGKAVIFKGYRKRAWYKKSVWFGFNFTETYKLKIAPFYPDILYFFIGIFFISIKIFLAYFSIQGYIREKIGIGADYEKTN
jgi:hypothetical protein